MLSPNRFAAVTAGVLPMSALLPAAPPMAHVPVPVMKPRGQEAAKPSLQARVAERLGMSPDSSDAEVLAELDSRMKTQATDVPVPIAILRPEAAKAEQAALAWAEGESPDDDSGELLSPVDRDIYQRAFGEG